MLEEIAPPVPPVQYPVARYHQFKGRQGEGKIVVIFTEQHVGMIVESTHPKFPVGYYTNQWFTHEVSYGLRFKPINIQITG